jgi:hypothetical protein
VFSVDDQIRISDTATRAGHLRPAAFKNAAASALRPGFASIGVQGARSINFLNPVLAERADVSSSLPRARAKFANRDEIRRVPSVTSSTLRPANRRASFVVVHRALNCRSRGERIGKPGYKPLH